MRESLGATLEKLRQPPGRLPDSNRNYGHDRQPRLIAAGKSQVTNGEKHDSVARKQEKVLQGQRRRHTQRRPTRAKSERSERIQ